MLAVTIAVARGIMRRKSVVGDTMEVFTVVVQVELVKERNVCTRKVPFAVTEVVPIVPRENIGSLPLSLSLSLSLWAVDRFDIWKGNARFRGNRMAD